MKLRTKAIMTLPVVFLLSACSEDFTLLSPISERNVEAFYQTPTDFDVAINGAYATLASNGAYNRSYVLLHEMRSDNTMNGGGATGLAEVFHRIAHFSELSTQEELSVPWTTAYQGIARTNLILDRVDNLEDQNAASRIRGEALFIRSLFYYHLAVLWGERAAAARGGDFAQRRGEPGGRGRGLHADRRGSRDGPGAAAGLLQRGPMSGARPAGPPIPFSAWST